MAGSPPVRWKAEADEQDEDNFEDTVAEPIPGNRRRRMWTLSPPGSDLSFLPRAGTRVRGPCASHPKGHLAPKPFRWAECGPRTGLFSDRVPPTHGALKEADSRPLR